MDDMLKLVVGIDGGATYSHGVAATLDGRVLAVTHSNSMNFTGSYQKEVRRRMNELVRELELQLPFSNEITHFAVSAAGIFNEATADQKEKLCGKIYPWKQTRLVGDSVAGYQAATLGKPGVLVICGTGTSVIVGNLEAKFTHLGGWGPLLEDKGSAYWIAVKAIRAAIDDFENTGEETAITSILCELYEIKNIQGIVPLIYHPEFTRDKFAILAARIDKVLQGKDKVFQKICEEAGTEAAKLTITAVEKSNLDISPLPVFFSGGVLTNNHHAQKAFEKTLRDKFEIMLSQPKLPTVLGTTILALRESGVSITDKIVSKLDKSYREVDELSKA